MKLDADLLNAMADGELSGDEKTAAEQALSEDPLAQAKFKDLLELKATIASKCAPVSDPEAWRACQSRMSELSRVKSTEGFVLRYSWALCAIFAIALASASWMNRNTGATPLSAGSVAGLVGGQQAEAATDGEQAIEIVRGRTGVAPRGLNTRPFRLLGLTIGAVEGRKFARMRLADSNGPFEVYVICGTCSIEGMDRRAGEYRTGVIDGETALAWNDRDCLLVATSDRSIGEMRRLADTLRDR